MLVWGDRQHDIAAYFGVNGERIAEVASGDRAHPNARCRRKELPPPGPYLTKFALQSVIDTVNEAIAAVELAEQEEEIQKNRKSKGGITQGKNKSLHINGAATNISAQRSKSDIAS